MLQKINEMIEMQKALDKAIYGEHNTQFDAEKCRVAMIDEIGELTHELKGNWCWWKKTQKPVDNEKVLEELVDIWHFCMSYAYNARSDKKEFNEECYKYRKRSCNDFKITYSKIVLEFMYSEYSLEYLMILTEHLGFTIDDVYNAYIKKNKENYERLANNY